MNELVKASDLQISHLEEFAKRINAPVDVSILKKTADGKANHIPISFIENSLREDFSGLYQIGIKSERRELNEYIIVASIKVFHPILKQWLEYDGIGAVQIMQDKGSTLSQFNESKKPNALMLNAPKAYSEAIKNAAKKIGKKYGSDLNREFEDSYEPIYTNEVQANEMLPELTEKLNKCDNLAELGMLWESLEDFQQQNSKIKIHFSNKKTRLQNAK